MELHNRISIAAVETINCSYIRVKYFIHPFSRISKQDCPETPRLAVARVRNHAIVVATRELLAVT